MNLYLRTIIKFKTRDKVALNRSSEFYCFSCKYLYETGIFLTDQRTSDGGNGNYSVSLLKSIKCFHLRISSLLVLILEIDQF